MMRLIRGLLRAYPVAFRAEFGAEMELLFLEAWHDAGRGVGAAAARFRLIMDLLRGAVTQHVSAIARAHLSASPPRSPGRYTMRDFFAEVRQAVRSLTRTPAFTLAVVLTLGLGIGANAAIFSVVDGVLLRPAPFRDLGRLAMLWETDRKSGTVREPASIPDYLDFKDRATLFGRLAAFSPISASLAPEGADPVLVPALWISHEFLPLVGIQPLLGRGFSEEEDRANGPPVALISETLWADLFARQASALGRSIRINDVPYTVVGVLRSGSDFGTLQILGAADYRRGFADRGGPARVDVWLPLQADPATASRDNHPIFVLGRLGPGATLDQGQQQMSAVAGELESSYPQANDGRGVHVEALEEVVFGGVRPALLVLLGAVALVLLVACANVANLLLARGAARSREVTVRAALGASVGRLSRQFLTESAVLTGAGVVLGLLLALGGLRLLLALAPASIPRVASVGLDARVLAATLGVAVLVCITFGMVPAFQARRAGLRVPLHGESSRGASTGREHSRFRSGLVVAELALAVVLMVGAGLLIKSLWRLYQVDPGFNAAGVLKAEFQLSSRYPQRMRDWPQWTEIRQFSAELRRRAAALPGVTSVAIASNHPLEAGYTSSIVVIGREAEAADYPEPTIRLVDPGYFPTMRVALLGGRLFAESDDLQGTPVILINQAARRRFFAGGDPLGHQIQLWGRPRTVVGVVADERVHGLAQAAPPAVYLPTSQAPTPQGSLLVRTSGDPVALAQSLRAVVRELDPALPLFGVELLSTTLGTSLAQRRFTMLVLGAFAGVALLLAVVGVHGVLSYTVAQRTREIGIRMALGANRATVGRLVVGQGLRLALGGLGLGLLGALALSGLLTRLLYGVSPLDPATFAGVGIALGGVALLATWAPARRASRVDPLVALRSE